MKKILVLGYFGYNTNQLDGQTVKTRDLYRLAKEQSHDNIDYYDTQDFQSNKFSIFKMFWKVIRCNTLFYLPAHNNLRYIFPIVYCLSLIFRFRIHYFVVGGWLKEFLANLPMHRYMLKHISGIHVETRRLKSDLEEFYKFKNVDVFPNFRFFEYDPKRFDSEKLRLVFMARVNKMKGLDWIFELADHIVSRGLQDKFSLTFFGPLSEDDKDYFESNIKKYSFAEYKGKLEPSVIHETLSQFDVMLLPTHYYTEGLPGSIVDAYISGIPVIVTEWKHSHEFVEDGISGYIIPFEDGQQQLIEKVLLLEQDRELLHTLQANALVKRMEFAPPKIEKIVGGKCLKICFVSRVEQSKGLDTLVLVAQELVNMGLESYVRIDFYGQKKDNYFDEHLEQIPMFNYLGVLQPEDVVSTLQQYDALIFPSHYEGEGCPGILVEALSAALPIIASDWKYNSEFVRHAVNGFLCETNSPESYLEAIIILLNHPELIRQMSKNAYHYSQIYSFSHARKLIIDFLHS